jgi:hypothetical protein
MNAVGAFGVYVDDLLSSSLIEKFHHLQSTYHCIEFHVLYFASTKKIPKAKCLRDKNRKLELYDMILKN